MHRHRRFHRTYPQNRHLSTVYESTIEQLQEQVASLKKSSENGSDQLRALREETIQITRRQKREAEDLIRTLQSQVMGNAAKRFVFQSAANQGGTDAARLFRSFAEVVEKASGMGCRTYKAPALSR